MKWRDVKAELLKDPKVKRHYDLEKALSVYLSDEQIDDVKAAIDQYCDQREQESLISALEGGESYIRQRIADINTPKDGGGEEMKDWIIKWAIKQIVKDGSGSYGDMKYLEDVLENKWGEKMFIFSHKLVPIDKVKLAAANNRAAETARSEPDAPQTATKADS